MAGSVNRAFIIGHLGRDPETTTLPGGGKVTKFSIATSDNWNDRQSGERQERTSWHQIVIWNEAIGEVAQRYAKKGSQLCVEGSIETRSFDKDGEKRYVTEIVIRPFSGNLTLLDRKPDAEPAERPAQRQQRGAQTKPGPR